MQEYLATELAFKHGQERGRYEILGELVKLLEIDKTSNTLLTLKTSDFMDLFKKYNIDESRLYDKRL